MATIIAITVIASLGTAIYSFVSTATLTQIGSMNDTQAYYLAESGGHYAIKRLAAIDSSDSTVRNALLTELAAAPYVVTNAGQFSLQGFAYVESAGFGEYRFTAKGTPADASVSRSISYVIKVPSAAGVSIPFDGSGQTLNANNWNVSGDARLDTSSQTVAMNDGHRDTQISLDWTNASSTLPDLLDVWNGSNGLLTYEVQAKVRLGNNQDVMAGISFRLQTQGDSNITNDSFYGLSYLWCESNSSGRDLPGFCGSDTSQTYIVLWKQAANGAQTVIGKQLASSVSPSLVNGSHELVDWATLVARVQEQFDPDTGVRENMISAYVGIPSTSPKGTIHWDYTKYLAVQWDSAFSGADCSGGLKSLVSDTTFITSNFDAHPQDEIGLHAFGNELGEVADLALRFGFNGGEAITCLNDAAGTITLTAATSSVSENGGTATITARRTGGALGAVGVSYATTDGGTATAGADYTATSGTLSWGNGDTANKTFTVGIFDDSLFESSETVNLALSNTTGGAGLGTPNTAVLTITDNDGVGVGTDFSATNVAVAASGTTLSGSFTVPAGSRRLLLVALSYEAGAAGNSITIPTATYGGQALTMVQRIDGTRERVWVGYLKEAGIAAASNTTLSVTMSANTGSATLKAGSFTGVNQTTPINASVKRSSDTAVSSYNFGSTALSVVDGGRAIFFNTWNRSNTRQTPPAGYTERYDHADGSSDAGFGMGSAYKVITANGTENPTITLSSAERYGVVAVSLQP